MAGSQTIPPGTTIASGYVIGAGAGPGFTLFNFGVLGRTLTGVGVNDESSGNEIENESGGTILASATGDGIRLADSGEVVNAIGGTISGGIGIYAPNAGNGGSTVTNQGTIAGTSGNFGEFGVRLNAGGFVTNEFGGAIISSYGGVDIEGAYGNIVNQSTIKGGAGGVFLRVGGYLGNEATGTITANYAVAIGGGSAVVKNAGQIKGGKLGVGVTDGGLVANLLGGTITGTDPVQISGGAGSVYNLGAINAAASGTAVSFGAGFANLLALYPGASFTGTINGGNTLGATAVSTLRLVERVTGEPAVGTLTGLGSKYVNFANVTVNSGASWVIGAGTFGALGPFAYATTMNVSGTLTNDAALRTAVILHAGGRLTNAAGGSIISERYGVDGRLIAGTIVNDGLVEGLRAGAIGIEGNGGAVTNQSLGTISGGLAGVLMLSNGPATVVNQGLIKGNSYTSSPYSSPEGVILQSGGLVLNQAGGTIGGVNGVIINSASGTLINAGTISATGGGKAVKLATGFANQVTIVPGAAFTGGVVDGGNVPGTGAVSALVLAAGPKTGTLTGLGSEYVNFGTLTVNQSASWVLAASTFQAGMGIADNGTLTNDGVARYGVTIGNYSVLINAAGGRITGRSSITDSVYAPATSSKPTLINSGYIGTPLNETVRFHDGGSVTNTANGLIEGLYGVVISGQTGTVTNFGTIETTPGAVEGIGVRLKSGGTLNNLAGMISGKLYGVYTGNNYVVAGPAFILNKGTISGGQTGVIITNSGINSGGTLTNAGQIDSGTSGFAVRFRPGPGDELDIVPGAVFSGLVYGGNAISATNTSLLRLNSAAAAGTLTGGSAVYEGFGVIAVDAGATWTFAAGGTIFAGTTLTDKGTLFNLGTLNSLTTLAGTSNLINANGALITAIGTGYPSAVDVQAGAVSTITNRGLIESSALSGPGVFSAGNLVSITNSSTGLIAGYAAINVTNGNASIANSGTIHGGRTFGTGVGFFPKTASTGTLTVINSLGDIDGFIGVDSNARVSSIVNSGTIIGHQTSGAGLYLYGGAVGMVTNQASGFIGGLTGALLVMTSITVENDVDARIGDATSQYGVYLHGGSASGDVQVTNLGAIAGYKAGIKGVSNSETLTNSGFIGISATASRYGVLLTGSQNMVTNTYFGIILGETAFAEKSSGTTLVNAGKIFGNATAGIGVLLDAGGDVTNDRNATITGLRGVVAYNLAPTTIRNAGLIDGDVSIQAGAPDLVEIRPGSTVVGVVNGGNPAFAASASTLGLGVAVPSGSGYNAGPSVGTLAELGSRYVNFYRVVIDPNAVWSLSGQNKLGAGGTLINNGSVTVDGQFLVDGVVNAGTNLLVIGNTADGSLTLENGGIVVTSGAGLDIGPTDGIGAEVVVTGTHSLLDVVGGEFVVGDQAQGDLQIRAGGTVITDTPDTLAVIGNGDGGSSVQLTGVGSEWRITGNLEIGEVSSGALSVQAGSTVTATGFVDIGTFNGADVASGNVSGSGAILQAGNVLDVGVFGTGVLSIGNGASVTASFFTVGDSATAVGQLNLTGSGSSLAVANDALVGNSGNGGMSLSNGATFSADTLSIAAQPGSTGAVSVTGDGSGITTTGSLSIGDAGAGELSILNGANVTIGGDFDIGLGGSGNVDIEDTTGTVYVGGNLNIGQNGGPAVLTVGPDSTLEVDNGFINGGPGGVLNLYTSIDPLVVKNLTINVAASDTTPENVTAYTLNDTFNLAEGADYILNTPSLVGTNSFTLGTVSDTDDTTLILNADTVSATTAIAFTNALGTLVIGTDQLATINSPTSGKSEANPNDGDAVIGGFHGVIKNFTAGDAIMVNTAGPATFSQSGSVISVIENGTTVGVLAFDTAANAQAAFTAPDALVDNALCFLAGTLIGTPEGQIEVERLAAGDRVLTASGAMRPVVWVGHGRVLATRGRRGPATPVIVRKGALGPNVPHQDLRVTKGHAFWFDGVLIPVEFLVNHRSILWDDRAQEVSVYHVELDAHDVLLANGAAAESYRDDGNRWLFQNANAGWDLPAKVPCAEVLTGGPVVDAVWRRLLEACGPRPSVPLTQDADVHMLVDGVRVDGVRTGDVPGDIHVFAVNASDRVRLVSRSAVPQELGVARDPRCLGVAVRRMSIRQGTHFRTVRGDDTRLTDGFHPFEAGTALRWTDGDATLPPTLFAGFSGPCELVIHLGGTASYIDDGAAEKVA